MTVVYTLGCRSQWHNNELRYSLRSFVKYSAVDRVIVVGFKPDWLVNVEHIPHEDGPRKQLNIHLKTLAACQVCPDFVQAADDHILLAPQTFATYYFSGTLQGKNFQGRYAEAWHNTYQALPTGLFYNLHIPMRMDSEEYKNIMLFYHWKTKDYLVKSLYANNVKGIPIAGRDDVKISRFMRREAIDKFIENKGFLSFSDAGLSTDLRRFLAERFPDPTVYEK